MKKTMVYIIAFAMAFSALLSGCGENMRGKDTPKHSPAPEITVLPEVEDGVVRDHDGIITEDDTGRVEQPQGNVSADPDVNAAANADRAAGEGRRQARP